MLRKVTKVIKFNNQTT